MRSILPIAPIVGLLITGTGVPVAAQTGAQPIRTVPQVGTGRITDRDVDARRSPWIAARSIYVDEWGRVTVWAGESPFERAERGRQDADRRRMMPSPSPCASGIGGAASASAAIGAAAGVDGRRC